MGIVRVMIFATLQIHAQLMRENNAPTIMSVKGREFVELMENVKESHFVLSPKMRQKIADFVKQMSLLINQDLTSVNKIQTAKEIECVTRDSAWD